MSKYFSNAITSFCMLLILTLCTCCYFGIDSMAELTKKAVGVLPFGKYIWDFYQVQTGTYENHIGSLSFTTLEFSKSLLKFVLTGYIYHFVVRKFVEFVLFDPIYDDEMVSKTYRISTKIKAEFFYNVGFALAALLAGSALEAFGRLPFFQNNAYPDLVRILQSVIYSLVSVAGIFEAYRWILLSCKAASSVVGAVFVKLVLLPLLKGAFRLFLAAGMLIFAHQLCVNPETSYALGVLIVMMAGLGTIIWAVKQ